MRPACSGFTMIEVLVALLLVGTGALAITMLQLHGLRNGRESAWQAKAAAMALELAELRAAWHTVAADGSDPYLFSVGPAPSASVVVDDCASACDAGGFARAAVADWSARLARELPGARAVVCRDGNPAPASGWRCDDLPTSPVVIKLGWRSAAASASFTSATAPLMALTAGR